MSLKFAKIFKALAHLNLREVSRLTGFLLSVVIMGPSLFLLSNYPQGPDGAEMLNTALNGGVLHPSGTPFQAWLNLLFVKLSADYPAWGLSFLSWLGYFLSGVGLTSLMRHFRVQFYHQIWILALFAFYPVFWSLALQPEKYTWMTALTIWFLVYLLKRNLWASAGLAGLCVAHHSALVVLLPLLALLVFEKKKFSPLLFTLLLIVAFQSSLLALRSSVPWPDWGHLTNLQDVWTHFTRQDYGGFWLHNRTPEKTLTGLEVLFQDLQVWTISVAILPFGLFALGKNSRKDARFILLGFFGALAILALAQLPDESETLVRAYLERYPVLVLPFLCVLLMTGLNFLSQYMPWPAQLAAGGLSIFYLFIQGYPLAHATRSEIISVYQAQVGSELRPSDIFFTNRDIDLFLGFPCLPQTCFPIKNLLGLKWYRESTLPQMQPAISETLKNQPPQSFFQLLTLALEQNSILVSTSASLFIEDPQAMTKAEQVGLTWRFANSNQSLYTKDILKNSLKLCRELQRITVNLSSAGPKFILEPLESIKYVYLSAHDYLNFLSLPDVAKEALTLATSLRPDVSSTQWQSLCQIYTEKLTQAKVLD